MSNNFVSINLNIYTYIYIGHQTLALQERILSVLAAHNESYGKAVMMFQQL